MSFIQLFRTGFVAGCGMAAALISVHVFIVSIFPNGSLSEITTELIEILFFIFFISSNNIDIDVAWKSIDMWVSFCRLMIANGVTYSVAIPAAYFINNFLARGLKKANLFFYKSKKSRHESPIIPSNRCAKDLINFSFLGFTSGLVVAIAVTLIVLAKIFFQPNYIMSSWLGDIIVFIYPAHLATIGITKFNFPTGIFIFALILINGIRYSILFFLFGVAWKFVCRHFGWTWR